MFTPSERKALKGVVNMSNLSITDHFIGPADLVTNMENYAIHMNSLCYNKKDNNVYNALPPKYHDFADIFQTAEKQSLPERSPHDHAIDLEPVTVVHYIIIVIITAFACSVQTANTLHAVYKLLTL